MEYRITKYNPIYRNDKGHYLKDEWTSIGDVGKIYDGNVFTMDEYLRVEKNHIDCLIEIANLQGLSFFKINNFENNRKLKLRWKNKMGISETQLVQLIRDCLREKCWCKIIAENFFIHFGYDYYVFVKSSIEFEEIKKICNNYELYAEQFDSPCKK